MGVKSSQPIQGFDVTVGLVAPNGKETFVGEFQESSFSISHDVEEYMATNSRTPELLEGDIKIEGTLKRGWFGEQIVKTIFGQSKIDAGTDTSAQHRLTLTMKTNNASRAGGSGSTLAEFKGLTKEAGVKLTGVLITKFDASFKGGKAIIDKTISFRATGIEDIDQS
jgi:hypothetical protein